MKTIVEFESWIKEMVHLGTISGSTAEKVVDFATQQQKEIDNLKKKKRTKLTNKIYNFENKIQKESL